MLPYTSILGMDEFRMRLQLKASFHICKNCVWAYELERLFILPFHTTMLHYTRMEELCGIACSWCTYILELSGSACTQCSYILVHSIYSLFHLFSICSLVHLISCLFHPFSIYVAVSFMCCIALQFIASCCSVVRRVAVSCSDL